MSKMEETTVFNNSHVFVEGWYWALPSRELRRGRARGIELMGKKLVFFRGASGRAYAMDAHCPHMGAHFKDGKVEGDAIRCAFHAWKFGADGKCVDIPCKKYSDQVSGIPAVATYQLREHYGLIWIHTNPDPIRAAQDPLPSFADLPEGSEVEVLIGARSVRPIRPEVVMLNAIDAHHFNSVHPASAKMAGNMDLRPSALGPQAIRLQNRSPVPKDSLLGKIFAPFYPQGVLTYFLDYWYASTGVVTVGPDAMHMFLLFPHRPTLGGGTEGIMLALAPKRRGWLGKLFGRFIVWVTYLTGSYFVNGDRLIFDSMQFSMKAPVKADFPILEFIRHTERQAHRPLPWTGARVAAAAVVAAKAPVQPLHPQHSAREFL